LAQRLSLSTLKPTGVAFAVAERIAMASGTAARVALSASLAGPVAYRVAAAAARRQLIWLDREGKQTGVIGEPDPTLRQLRISPDGHTVAIARGVGGNTDIWLIEVARGVAERVTSDQTNNSTPVWSPDGDRVAFASARRGVGHHDLYVRSVTDANERLLVQSSEDKSVQDWSPDGSFILYTSTNATTSFDLWALPLDGNRQPFVVVQTPLQEVDGQFSPDGRWIAYASNEPGRFEIYVRPFPGPGRSVRVSTNGGRAPQWRANGRELYYLSAEGGLMAVAVGALANGAGVSVGTPVPLGVRAEPGTYAASADGRRFLVNRSLDDAATPPITILLNWKPPVD
jgi:Tol biopolymer transport system component